MARLIRRPGRPPGRRGRGRRAAALGAALTLAVTAWTGAQVGSAPEAAATTPPVGFTADDLPTWQTNGVVWALAQSDGVVFAGGTFSAIRPPGAEAGTDEDPALNFAAFDAATGQPTGCSLDFTVGSGTATVRALAVSPDGGTLYAGGRFGAVNGTGVSNLAAIDLADCSVDTGFRVAVSATVRALDVTADTVYLGGDFTTVEGESRGRFAAVGTDGTLKPWDPRADKPGRALEVTPDGEDVILGGDFDYLGWSYSHALAVVDAGDASLTKRYGWGFIDRTSVVKGLATDATGFYTANEGTGGGVFDGRIALDLDDFGQRWRDTCLGATQDVEVHGSVLYSASHAHNCRSMGQFPELNERQHLLAEHVDDPTPLLSWFPDTDDGPSGTEQIGPRAMVASAKGGTDYMWVGGEFTRIVTHGNMKQQGLVRFAGGPDTGDPSVPDQVTAANVSGGVKVSWRASIDEDDSRLTYRVYRNGSGTPVHTMTADSLFWDRPTLSFTDTTVDGGTDYTYRITASDAGDANTSSQSDGASVTTPGTPSQTTVEREPVADAYVNGAATSATYGTHQQLAVRGSSAYESYLRYELPAAPGGMTLTEAKLTLTTSGESYAGSADSHRVVPVTGSWSEPDVTYATRPSLGGTVLGTLPEAPALNTAYTVELDTAAVAAALNGDYDIALTSEGTDSLWLWAHEAGSSRSPKLSLTFEAP
ncbi:DNRLRE domain-containing protein [Streptomyces sp. JJ36]|uniref:CBM96 family carbohydrate-binding protein n=1 Tax=Streptomyces sp. JJ36 TaxID=2736645 RepID=UPI001F3AC603|nr:DNRLRE domain-containing protein [Streptomyces sp. JJ36]MCF6521869.1 DNRLRE domain-containing protein [Streptomyces sp. JJ36]